jgi:hypothetical protein
MPCLKLNSYIHSSTSSGNDFNEKRSYSNKTVCTIDALSVDPKRMHISLDPFRL